MHIFLLNMVLKNKYRNLSTRLIFFLYFFFNLTCTDYLVFMLTRIPKHGRHVMPCWKGIKKRPAPLHFLIMMWFSPQISTLSPNRDTIIFNTFLSLPLSVLNNSCNPTPLLPLLLRWNRSMEFLRGVRHIIAAQAMQTARGPHWERALMDVVPLEEDMPDLPVPDNRLCLPGEPFRGCAVVFVTVYSVTVSRCRAFAVYHHG